MHIQIWMHEYFYLDAAITIRTSERKDGNNCGFRNRRPEFILHESEIHFIGIGTVTCVLKEKNLEVKVRLEQVCFLSSSYRYRSPDLPKSLQEIRLYGMRMRPSLWGLW